MKMHHPHGGKREEKISTVVVENFPMLGKASAWRFLEWAQGSWAKRF